MAGENWEAVDVNAVVEKVKLQMNKLAEEEEVTIHIEAGDLPLARAISSRLEQILLNLVLNAIQQISKQRETMAALPKQEEGDLALLQKGQIIIRPQVVETDPDRPIQILVLDTGPGIPYPDRKRIFLLDTTTREEGHGWGLFISRNLAELMHGRLRLAGSLRFIGSAFAVELPSFS
jgi:signal transduction histidine kinase